MPKISKRLLAIAGMVIRGEPTADIGADHALLSIYLVKNNIVPRVIIGELADGPYRRAAAAVQESSCGDKIEIRKGNGLDVLKPGEVVNIIIAGMGGETIVDILSHDWQKSASYCRYVFQPMSRPDALRRELSLRGWPILDECLVEENKKHFVIISSCPGNLPYKLSPLEMELGPVLLQKGNLKKNYLVSYLKKYRAINDGFMQSLSVQKQELIEDYDKRIRELEAMLRETEG